MFTNLAEERRGLHGETDVDPRLCGEQTPNSLTGGLETVIHFLQTKREPAATGVVATNRETALLPHRRYCSRFMKGFNDHDFHLLSDEPGRELSWVSPPEQVEAIFVGAPDQPPCRSAREAMLAVGFREVFIDARLAEGMRFRLALLPVDATLTPTTTADDAPAVATSTTGAFQITWDALIDCLPQVFGADIGAALAPHREALKATPYHDIDVDGAIDAIAMLPAAERRSHPDYRSVSNLRQLISIRSERTTDDNVSSPSDGGAAPLLTLSEARAFFYHAVGCNPAFRGDGRAPNGQEEWVVPNRPLSSIPGAIVFDVDPSSNTRLP